MGSASIRITPVARAVLLCATLAAACPAGAQMYKWVDERGQVSYSNTLPPDTAQKKVVTVAERLSVYTPDAELNRALSAEGRREAKAESLRRQLEAERAAHRTPPLNDLAARTAAAYERCVADRRIDCEAIRSGDPMYGYTGYYGPHYAIGARAFAPSASFFVSNAPATPVGINPAPPAGISTAPRVGIDDRPGVGAPARNTRTTSRFR